MQRKGALLRDPLLVERRQAPGPDSRTADISKVSGYRRLCSENMWGLRDVEGLLVELTGDAIGKFRTSLVIFPVVPMQVECPGKLLQRDFARLRSCVEQMFGELP